MILSEFEKKSIVKILIDENKQHLCWCFENDKVSSLVDILKSRRSLIDELPECVFNTYIDDITKNFERLCRDVDIRDINRLLALIDSFCENPVFYIDVFCLQKYFITHTTLELDELLKLRTNILSTNVILNCYTKTLPEEYIINNNYFLKCVALGFFIHNKLTLKIAKKIFWASSKEKKNFYSTICLTLDNGVDVKIDDDAFEKFLNKHTVSAFAKHLIIPGHLLAKTYKLLLKNNKSCSDFITNQAIDVNFALQNLNDEEIKNYIINNKHCSAKDASIIFKKRKVDMHSIYKSINISERTDFYNMIKSEGNSMMLNVALINILDSNVNDINIRGLFKCNVPRESIDPLVKRKVAHLDLSQF